eukprot:TRINITY_DN10671_c0_g2_i1.p1 TRINITY_DN10671_c0_g2~~TRINITY_DN10671_c0_g2_i1.p1  ORF type:complete len:1202 (-),score=269.81 TRINITY_DN10671_c0_g2_i1:312-3917(-)
MATAAAEAASSSLLTEARGAAAASASAPRRHHDPVRLYKSEENPRRLRLRVSVSDQVGFLFRICEVLMQAKVEITGGHTEDEEGDLRTITFDLMAPPDNAKTADSLCYHLEAFVERCETARPPRPHDVKVLERHAVNPDLLSVAFFGEVPEGTLGREHPLTQALSKAKRASQSLFKLELRGINQPGLLAYMSLVFFRSGFNIVDFRISAPNNAALGTFLLSTRKPQAPQVLRMYLDLPYQGTCKPERDNHRSDDGVPSSCDLSPLALAELRGLGGGNSSEGAPTPEAKAEVAAAAAASAACSSGAGASQIRTTHRVVQFPNGDSYCGECAKFPEGERLHGEGEYRYNRHSHQTFWQYVGQWEEGRKHGRGVLLYQGGGAYAGDWCQNQRHGRGVQLEYEAGEAQQASMPTVFYEGEWARDKMEGYGVEETPSSSYFGHFCDGLPSADGGVLVTWSSGRQVSGCEALRNGVKVPLRDALEEEAARLAAEAAEAEAAAEGSEDASTAAGVVHAGVPGMAADDLAVARSPAMRPARSPLMSTAAFGGPPALIDALDLDGAALPAAAASLPPTATAPSLAGASAASPGAASLASTGGQENQGFAGRLQEAPGVQPALRPSPTLQWMQSPSNDCGKAFRGRGGSFGSGFQAGSFGSNGGSLPSSPLRSRQASLDEDCPPDSSYRGRSIETVATTAGDEQQDDDEGSVEFQLDIRETEETGDSGSRRGPITQRQPSKPTAQPQQQLRQQAMSSPRSLCCSSPTSLPSPVRMPVWAAAQGGEQSTASGGGGGGAASSSMPGGRRPLVCPMLWSEDEIAAFISCLGIGRDVAQRVRRHRMRGADQLLQMEEQELQDLLGAGSPAAVVVVRRALKRFLELDRWQHSVLGRSMPDTAGDDLVLRDFVVPLEDLELGEEISQGGFGTVYRGLLRPSVRRNTTEFTPVAVKDMKGDKNVRLNELLKEGRIMASLNHPNICKFVGICTGHGPRSRGKQYVLSELMDCSLFDLIHQPMYTRWTGQLTTLVTAELFTQIAAGVGYLHEHNLVHADLKSSNVLIMYEGMEKLVPKICDFGHVAVRAHPAPHRQCGTPHWAAPEALRNEAVAPPADIFSIGVMLWEALSFQVPHRELSFAQVLGAVGWAHWVPSENYLPDLPEDLLLLLRACFRQRQEERPSASEVRSRLRQLVRRGRRDALSSLRAFLDGWVGCGSV